jgi:hypothetical protein
VVLPLAACNAAVNTVLRHETAPAPRRAACGADVGMVGSGGEGAPTS